MKLSFKSEGEIRLKKKLGKFTLSTSTLKEILKILQGEEKWDTSKAEIYIQQWSTSEREYSF